MAYVMTDADKSVMGNMKKKAATQLAATTAVENPTSFTNPLNETAKKAGFTDNAYGQGNAAFNMEAAKSLSQFAKENPNAPTVTGMTDQARGAINMYNGYASTITPQGMGNNTTTAPVKSDAVIYKEKFEAAAEIEATRRRTAAANLYQSTLSNLDAENAGIEPMFNETIDTISKGGFNNTEAMKELMNANGWGMGNSGLAIGEVDKIAIDTQKSKDKTAIQRDQALADIARRKTLAASLRDNAISDTDSWKAAQMMGVEAEAFLKAKEMAKAEEKLKYDKQITDSQLGIQKDDLQLRKDKFAADEKLAKENSKMAADEIFTKNTGLTRLTNDSIASDNPLRNETDYQSVINKIQSDPNWMNDPAARYNFAAATMLRNQKINAMKETSPDQYNQYKDSINLNGELMSTLPNVQWYKQFQSNENQRGFDNNLKTETFNENKRSNLVKEGFDSRQIGVSEGNNGLGWAKFNYDSDPNNPDNLAKIAQVSGMKDATVIKGMETRHMKESLTGKKTFDYAGVARDLQTMQSNGVSEDKLKVYADYFGIPYSKDGK